MIEILFCKHLIFQNQNHLGLKDIVTHLYTVLNFCMLLEPTTRKHPPAANYIFQTPTQDISHRTVL